MPLTLTPSVARALRGRDASQLRGAALGRPSVAPGPRAFARGGAGTVRIVCIAAGLEGASDAGRDEAWEAAQRVAADIRRRNPTTDFGAPKPELPKKGATNAELNNRYVDGGLPRDAPLPLSLAYRFDEVRTLAPQPSRATLFRRLSRAVRSRVQTRVGAAKPCTISESQSCSVRALPRALPRWWARQPQLPRHVPAPRSAVAATLLSVVSALR